MTRIYRRRLHVRGYEVDATGRVHDSVFLYYVQQAAYEASVDAGYDSRRYDALGGIWVVRRQIIVYLAPLFYGDTVELTTWVSEFSRVRSPRECVLRRVSDARVVAAAWVEWVYIDSATRFPRRIPREMVDAFQPNGRGALDSIPPVEPARTVDGRPFVGRHRVKSYELDNLRHVNNANYLNWLNQARLDALTRAGFPLDESATRLRGLGLMLTPVRYEIEYFTPAIVGDVVEVHSRVVKRGRTQLTWSHRICRGEERLVAAEANICFGEEDGTVVPVPMAVVEAVSHKKRPTLRLDPPEAG